jgi:hypothetical protein
VSGGGRGVVEGADDAMSLNYRIERKVKIVCSNLNIDRRRRDEEKKWRGSGGGGKRVR